MTNARPSPDAAAQSHAAVASFSERQWRDAKTVAAFLAVDPAGLGGARIRSAPGPARDQWAAYFRALLPESAPFRKLPIGAETDAILGGLDLAATLRAGAPKGQRGVLANADGGVLVASMAERMSPAAAALVSAAMDQGVVVVERGGLSVRDPARFCCILYDEGLDLSEAPPEILLERVAFHIDLNGVRPGPAEPSADLIEKIKRARHRLRAVLCPDEIAEAVATTGEALGAPSLRALLFCIRTARVSAALGGRDEAAMEDAEIASRLVFGPRALADLPPPPAPPEPTQENSPEDKDQDETPEQAEQDKTLDEILVEAARAAALEPMFTKPAHGLRRRGAVGAGGKSGALVESALKGRPVGARKGDPRDGARLDLLATLRAAAPWKKLRGGAMADGRLPIRKDDLHIKRLKGRTETVVIFVVDASGSSAMYRMNEAKGAVELLLSDCYSRRDYVALIAFRGEKADLALPPTRSLLRVRRQLGALPGGGGTPLASGVAAAATLAETEKRKGKTPFVVILSDGRGNIALNGEPDRRAAEEDLRAAARRLRETDVSVLFFDTATRPSPRAQSLSEEIGARYAPLPFADSARVTASVKRAIAAGS